jgi:hypothetical protein
MGAPFSSREQSIGAACGAASASITRVSARCPNTEAARTSGAWRSSANGSNQAVIGARFMARPLRA